MLSKLNLDDHLLGKFTKYGTASGDIDLYSTVNKNKIKQILEFYAHYELVPGLRNVIESLHKSEVEPSDLSDDDL